MGIIRSNAAFYLDARRRGAGFTRTLTLDRQRLYVHQDELTDLARTFRPELAGGLGDLRYGDPADAFLRRFLDAGVLLALDQIGRAHV